MGPEPPLPFFPLATTGMAWRCEYPSLTEETDLNGGSISKPCIWKTLHWFLFLLFWFSSSYQLSSHFKLYSKTLQRYISGGVAGWAMLQMPYEEGHQVWLINEDLQRWQRQQCQEANNSQKVGGILGSPAWPFVSLLLKLGHSGNWEWVWWDCGCTTTSSCPRCN